MYNQYSCYQCVTEPNVRHVTFHIRRVIWSAQLLISKSGSLALTASARVNIVIYFVMLTVDKGAIHCYILLNEVKTEKFRRNRNVWILNLYFIPRFFEETTHLYENKICFVLTILEMLLCYLNHCQMVGKALNHSIRLECDGLCCFLTSWIWFLI